MVKDTILDACLHCGPYSLSTNLSSAGARLQQLPLFILAHPSGLASQPLHCCGSQYSVLPTELTVK
jgi:hypothetical protein